MDGSRIKSVGCKSGLGIAIYRDNCKEQVFVHIHGCPLPPQECVEVIVVIDEEPKSYKAQQFLGGQRYLLDEEGGDAVIEALYNEKTVTIKLGPYSKDFEAGNFSRLYSKN